MDRPRYHYVHQPESGPLEGKNRPQSTSMSLNRSEIGQAEIPSGKGGGGNLYGMVGNDAINGWDYLGLVGPDEPLFDRDAGGHSPGTYIEYQRRCCDEDGVSHYYDLRTHCCENKEIVKKVKITVLIRQGGAGHVDMVGGDGVMYGFFTQTGSASSGAAGTGAAGIGASHDPSAGTESWYDDKRPQYSKFDKAKKTNTRTVRCTKFVCPAASNLLTQNWGKVARNPGEFTIHGIGDDRNCSECTSQILTDSGIGNGGGSSFPFLLENRLAKSGWRCSKPGFHGFKDGKEIFEVAPPEVVENPYMINGENITGAQ